MRTRWAVGGMVIGVLGSALARTGLPKPEPAEANAGRAARTVGTIDGTVRSVTQGVQEFSENVQGQFDRARASSNDQTLKARVEASLRENEALNASEIDVTVVDEGVVILKGEVAAASDKELAVSLARELRGVSRVEDNLAITPKLRVFSAPSTADRTGSVAK